MSITNKISEFTDKCKLQKYPMCTKRDNSVRTCVLPRCCTIYPEVRYCEYSCYPLSDYLRSEEVI